MMNGSGQAMLGTGLKINAHEGGGNILNELPALHTLTKLKTDNHLHSHAGDLTTMYANFTKPCPSRCCTSQNDI